jgi:uncharacterized damage-inducible protein DinB
MQQKDTTVEGVIRAYRKCHIHLQRMLENLTDENLQTKLPGSKESLSRVFQHIINAECYWLEQVKEPRPGMVKRPDPATVRSALIDLEKSHLDMLARRGHEREANPKPIWITLRVTQHDIYHSAQIALIRRLLGVPAVPLGEAAPPTWEEAVDELSALALRKNELPS